MIPPDSSSLPVIAVVGLCGVGKSEATRYMASEFGMETVYFGGQITREVERRGLAVNQTNEKLVREELRNKFGMDAIARLAKPQIDELLDANRSVCIDGLYSWSELRFLTGQHKMQISTIAVHSPRQLRYERMAKRKVRPLSKTEVDLRDKLEIENLEKAQPIALADYHVVNDSGLSDLHHQLRSCALSISESSLFRAS